MIDWSLAQRIGTLVATDPPDATGLDGDLAAFTADAIERVTAYTGMTPARAIPAPEAVGRKEWLRANLGSMRQVMDPIERKLREGASPDAQPSGLPGALAGALSGPMRNIQGGVLGAEIGGLVGYLAGRVLGQYELVLLDPSSPERLLFVAPNLREAARKLEVEEAELVHWVAFHEVTHAVQFTSVPWLREHLAGMLGQLLESVDVKMDTSQVLKGLSLDDVRGLVDRVREGGLMTLAAGEERMAIIDRMQCTMAVVEGHAEHVMDAVGADALRSLDDLREALDRRRDSKPPVAKLLEKLLGLEMKMRQYQLGKAWCDAVVERGGIAALNHVWTGPDALPSAAELELPELWLGRTGVA